MVFSRASDRKSVGKCTLFEFIPDHLFDFLPAKLKGNDPSRGIGPFNPLVKNDIVVTIWALQGGCMLCTGYLSAAVRANLYSGMFILPFFTILALAKRTVHHFFLRTVDRVPPTVLTLEYHVYLFSASNMRLQFFGPSSSRESWGWPIRYIVPKSHSFRNVQNSCEREARKISQKAQSDYVEH